MTRRREGTEAGAGHGDRYGNGRHLVGASRSPERDHRRDAFAFSISVTIFGGFAPFVATWLIAQTDDPLSPSYYLMATALLSIIALMAIERRTSAHESR